MIRRAARGTPSQALRDVLGGDAALLSMRPRREAVLEAKRILVAVNGNPTDRDVVALACQHARRNKAEVFAIYVIEVKRTLPLDADLPPEAARGEGVLEEAERVAAEWDHEIHVEMLQARDAGTALVDEAAQRDVDLIVMGVTYRKRASEFDLGNTLPYVLKNAPCRVWVLRDAMQ